MAWPLAVAAGVGFLGNMIGGHQDRQADKGAAQAAREAEARNTEMQREFAQQGVRWKVDDAKAAGIHPLYALGAQTSSFSPVSVGDTRTSSPGQAFRDSGQDISRAIQATRTADERKLADIQLASARLDVEGKALDNQIRASQLQKMNSPAAVGPALPSPMDSHIIPGQGNAVRVKPSEVYASERGRPGIQSGMINSLQYTREANGNIAIVPSEQMKERMEDDFIAESMWHLKNRIMPPAPRSDMYPIPEHLRRQGFKYWFWNPLKQEFVPSKNP